MFKALKQFLDSRLTPTASGLRMHETQKEKLGRNSILNKARENNVQERVIQKPDPGNSRLDDFVNPGPPGGRCQDRIK